MDKQLGKLVYPTELTLCFPAVGNMAGMEEGCCICGSDIAVDDNLLVYCDGPGCNIGVHEVCYGIEKIPDGPWLCQKCEPGANYDGQHCRLCISSEGALKKTDTGDWAHVLCALYIPGSRFADEKKTLKPIYVSEIPVGRFNKTCYICEQGSRISEASSGACMSCGKSECPMTFHVTCGQKLGLLCKKTEPGRSTYLGFCQNHVLDVKESKILKKLMPFSRTTRSTFFDGLTASNEFDGSRLDCVNDTGPCTAPMMAMEVEVTSEDDGGGSEEVSTIIMEGDSPNNSVKNRMGQMPKLSNEQRVRAEKLSSTRFSRNGAVRFKRRADCAVKSKSRCRQLKPLHVKRGNGQLRRSLRKKAQHREETAKSPVEFRLAQDGEPGAIDLSGFTPSTNELLNVTKDSKAPASATSFMKFLGDSDINDSNFTTPNFHSVAEVCGNYEVAIIPDESDDASCFADNCIGANSEPSAVDPISVASHSTDLEYVLDKTWDPISLSLGDMSPGLSIPDLLSHLFHLKSENRALESRISHLTESRENLKEVIAISSLPLESSGGNMVFRESCI